MCYKKTQRISELILKNFIYDLDIHVLTLKQYPWITDIQEFVIKGRTPLMEGISNLN